MNKLLDIRPAYALAAAPPYPSPVGGYGGAAPLFAQLAIFESFEMAPEIAPAVESELEDESQFFLPEQWVNQFDHNETHVQISAGNETFDLLWKDELVNH